MKNTEIRSINGRKKGWRLFSGDPVIIRSRIVPKHYCINLFGTFWARDTLWIDGKVINHERIHTAQQRELLFLFFYIAYLIEWLLLLLRHRNFSTAYLNISFEKEAYRFGGDLSYLSRRKHFAQWRKGFGLKQG